MVVAVCGGQCMWWWLYMVESVCGGHCGGHCMVWSLYLVVTVVDTVFGGHCMSTILDIWFAPAPTKR